MNPFLAKIEICHFKEFVCFYLIKKCRVSYDTLAGIPWMSHSRITKIVERVSCEGPYDKITWQKLSERIKKISPSLDAVEIGRILQSYSKVQYRDIKLLYKLAEEIKTPKKLKQMDLLSCASISHALNNLNFKDNELFHLIFLRIKELNIDKHSSFPIVIIQNAYSQHCHENSFRHMALELLIFFFQKFDIYKRFCTPQGFSMLLNSFAQILKPSPYFLKNRNQVLSSVCIDESKFLSNIGFAETEEPCLHPKESVVCLTHHKGDSPLVKKRKEKTMVDEIEQAILFEEDLKGHMLHGRGFVQMEKDQLGITEKRYKEKMDAKQKEEMLIKEKEQIKVSSVKERETNEISKNEELLKKYFFKLLLEISKNLEKMNPHSLSLIINSCTRIQFEISTEFIKMLTEETNRKVHLASIRHLSLIINGYIKLKITNPLFLSNIFNEIEKKVFFCDDQQLCFILNSMYKLNKKNENLLKNINSKFILIVRKMNVSTLCNVLYFYTKLGVFSEDIFHLFEIYLKKLIHEANIHHLSLAAYVFSKNKKKENEIIFTILKRAEQILKTNNNCLYEQTGKAILILINSLSELNIFSRVMGEYLYFFVHINETKIDTEESEKKLHKLKRNIQHLETHVQEKILGKQIYISTKTLSLYDAYIAGTV